MRIGVTGGRGYSNRGRVYDALRVFDKNARVVPQLVYGVAYGADTLAADYADMRGWYLDPFPAYWEQHGKAAGPIRNQAMVDSGLDVLLAFPGGRGTKDMVTRAKSAGILVLRVDDE